MHLCMISIKLSHGKEPQHISGRLRFKLHLAYRRAIKDILNKNQRVSEISWELILASLHYNKTIN